MTEGQLALFIPIIFTTLGMAVAIVYIVGQHRRSAQALDQRHRERMSAIDKGLDVPPDAEVPVKVSRPRYLLRGLIWLFVGLAIVFGAREALQSQAASFGWIPIAVGVAYLIFYVVEGRKESAKPEQKEQSHDR